MFAAESKLQSIEDLEDSDYLTTKNVLSKAPFKNRHSVISVSLANSAVTEVDIQKLLEAGLNVARFRMPQQTKEDKLKLMSKIERAIDACCFKYGVRNWPLATCLDLKTRTVKTGINEEAYSIKIKENSDIILTCDVSYFNKCDASRIFLDNYELGTEVKVGMEISIEGDTIALICKEILDEKTVKAHVVKGGELLSLSTVCFRCRKSSRPFITPGDVKVLEFAVEHHIDVIVINYVEDGEEIRKIKKLFGKKARRPILLSSICTEGGLDNIDDIAKESDGVVLSREYLPYEVRESYKYRINNIQKWLLAKCQQAGKPMYLSGELIPDPLTGNFPDCETADITNALLDGVSGIILKDSDSIDDMIRCVQLLNEISCDIEPYCTTNRNFWDLTEQYMIPVNAAEACVISCVALANLMHAKVIILPTVTGRTARALLQMKPLCIILAVCTNIRVANMLRVFKSMVPIMYSGEQCKITPESKITHDSKIPHVSTHARINFAVEYALKMDWLKYRDPYVVLKRHSEDGSYCDEVTVWSVTVSAKPMIECDE